MWNFSKNSFLLSLVRGVFLKSECKSTNYFPNTQEFRRKSLKINSYLTVRMKNKRLSCPTLIILYTRERGLRVCGRTGEGKYDVFNKQSLTFWLSETCRRLTTHIHAVYSCSNCRKTRSQLQNQIAPTGKIFFPNWEIIFFTVKHNLLANKYTEAFLSLFSGYYCCLFLIVLRDNETSCQTKFRKAKTCLAYQGQFWSSIKTELGRLLWPTSAIY